MGLWSVKLICFYHLSWSVVADRQQPRIAVHPLDSLCLSSQVWRTIFSSVWAAALMCAMFFTCSSSFHFISWAGLLWRSAIWLMCLCVFGCFGVDLRGCFYFILFFFFCLSAKRESSQLLQAFCSTRSDCPDVPEWKTVFVRLFFDTWNKIAIFINFYGTGWKEKVFDSMNFNWFSLDKKSSDCYVYLCNLDFSLRLSLFPFLCTFLYWWLLKTEIRWWGIF